jgi:NitT/TauT family transport system ATP-binding protein
VSGAANPAETAGTVECLNLRKVFRTGGEAHEVFRSVSFSIASGEFVALLGPSGCGKSTLLMMIAGLEGASGGRLLVAGREIDGPRSEIGIMFQDPTLLPWKSALDNILFPIDMMRRPRREAAARALALLRLVGLEGAERRKPRQLSGGMRQRVAICRALITDPRILLMDEPFSALDAITRDEMNIVLLDIWQRYRPTAVFVTHSIREAVFLADRVLVMGSRPATIISDTRMPFARPRDFAIGDSREFNEICRMLRDQIGLGHGSSGVPQQAAATVGE